MRYDPTDEARGWYRAGTKTRNLQRIRSPRRVRVKGSRAIVTVAPSKLVYVTHKRLLAPIGTYLLRAEALNLNLEHVAALYRARRDVGYGFERDVTTNETHAFRGREV